MAERSNARDSKSRLPFRVTRVQIPFSPPKKLQWIRKRIHCNFFTRSRDFPQGWRDCANRRTIAIPSLRSLQIPFSPPHVETRRIEQQGSESCLVCFLRRFLLFPKSSSILFGSPDPRRIEQQGSESCLGLLFTSVSPFPKKFFDTFWDPWSTAHWATRQRKLPCLLFTSVSPFPKKFSDTFWEPLMNPKKDSLHFFYSFKWFSPEADAIAPIGEALFRRFALYNV